MIRVSAAVMAHPSRAQWVPPLIKKLSEDAGRQVDWAFDKINDCWDTARRAWLMFDPKATHHVVIQDDAAVCNDLIPGIEKALEFAPTESIVSLYVGTRRPQVNVVNRAVREADETGASWIVMNQLNWGVGVVVPVPEIPAMVEWCDQRNYRGDDARIGRYFADQKGWPTWCPWPSLVDHRPIPSVVRKGGGQGRHAHRFIGENASALDMDFNTGHVIMDVPGSMKTVRRSTKETRTMAQTEPVKTAKKATKAAKKTAKSKKTETATVEPVAEISADAPIAEIQDAIEVRIPVVPSQEELEVTENTLKAVVEEAIINAVESVEKPKVVNGRRTDRRTQRLRFRRTQ